MSRGLRWGAVVLAVLLLLGAAVLGWVHALIDAEYLEETLNRVIGPATGGLYSVQIGALEMSFWEGALRTHDVRLQAADNPSDDSERELPAVRFGLAVDELAIEGVQLMRLAWTRDLYADRVLIRAPQLSATAGRRGATRAAATDVPASERLRELLARAPELSLERIEVLEASARLDVPGDNGDAGASYRIERVDLTLQGFRIDADLDVERIRGLFSDDVRLSVQGASAELAGRYQARAERVDASTRQRLLLASGLSLRPALSRDEFLRRATNQRDDRIEASAESVRVDGFEAWRLVESLEILAPHVALTGFELDVLADKRGTSTSRGGAPAAMPHDFFRGLETPFAVQRLDLTDGTIRYAEIAADGNRPGELLFDEIRGTLTNATNDPAADGPDTPAILDLNLRFMQSAQTALRIDIPLLQEAPTLTFAGWLGPFDPQVLNRVLPPLEGIRVTEGHVSGIVFDLQLTPHRARGTVNATYENFKIRLEDKRSGKTNLGRTLLSFAANTLRVKDDNPPSNGGQPRVGAVDVALDPADPFFKTLWVPLREGLWSVLTAS